MKKIKKILKNNFKLIIAFIVGLLISWTSVYAATILFNSNEVSYNNSSSGLQAGNVQDALDELYTKAQSSGSSSGSSLKEIVWEEDITTIYWAYESSDCALAPLCGTVSKNEDEGTYTITGCYRRPDYSSTMEGGGLYPGKSNCTWAKVSDIYSPAGGWSSSETCSTTTSVDVKSYVEFVSKESASNAYSKMKIRHHAFQLA